MKYLRESAIVPKIAFMWEAVPNKTELPLLDILLDWIEGFFFGDL